MKQEVPTVYDGDKIIQSLVPRSWQIKRQQKLDTSMSDDEEW